ncbi:Lrp/AsnC family transcriptional regulator [Kitasatospora sp. NBC_01266]|uniref:Lrp/AsnC family transcriptional regulator n=1 Tax=Kitasatospora sp. NBC_01266 TaxID=2903572 RepID=UPI002E333C0D|nr:Lrp/AsnC family transcriptional regulator [Kitasatospora sp. NBC_01266]
MESLDLQLVHALQIDGRAPLRRIASVLGVSEQLVARRYTRLCETAGLRVIGRLNPRPVGQSVWALRLQCLPGASLGLARTLAEREDTRWVQLASGATEIICHLTVHRDQAQDAPVRLLGSLPGVTSITAHRLLRLFKGGPTTWGTLTSALDQEQRDALAPGFPPPDARSAPVELTGLDHVLLAALTRDGRATHAALAAEARCHESTVRRRIAHLRAAGALFFALDVDERLLGDPAATALWMSVRPSQLAAAGAALAGHPEVAYAAATTGRTNLRAAVLCPDDEYLYSYLTDRLGALPGVDAIETVPIVRTLKRVGAVTRRPNRPRQLPAGPNPAG